MTSGGITSFIVNRYHNELRRRLPALLLLAKAVEEGHANSPHLPKKLSDILYQFTIHMFEHMDLEEQVLFPQIDARNSTKLNMPITQMEQEHEQHIEKLRLIKTMTNNFKTPSDACPKWEALYKGLEELEAETMEHINLENNVLFPRALDSMKP